MGNEKGGTLTAEESKLKALDELKKAKKVRASILGVLTRQGKIFLEKKLEITYIFSFKSYATTSRRLSQTS